MPCQLPTDCLNEIFEYLALDKVKVTLHSCLFVNRLWCEISVRILWRSIWNCNTCIACLPTESMEILRNNEIIISTQPPIFNYIMFIKNLSIRQIDVMAKIILKNDQSITSQSLNNKRYIVAQEIFIMFMSQIPSLKEINFFESENIPNINFTSYPGAKDCLKDLTRLRCYSDIYPEFFYQLSQICHNIQYLNITFKKVISNGITDLISIQQNLKYLNMMQTYDCEDLKDIIPELPRSLIRLVLYGGAHDISLLFITKFTNLQELILSFHSYGPFEDFNKIQYVHFPQLQILKFPYICPRFELLINFLEINGKSLKEFYIESNSNSLNLAIARFCPNLKILSTLILDFELETLERIFSNCQYLENIRVRCGDKYLNERELLKVIARYSPKHFYKLELYYMWDAQAELLPNELESFFINWLNRIPKKSLSLVITSYSNINSFNKNEENMKIIEKYIKLGAIKEFRSQ